VQRRQGVIAAGVAGDQVQVGHRNVELGVLGISQHQEFRDLILDLQSRQPEVATDTVIDMHHRRAFAQLGEVFDHRIVVAAIGAFFPAATLHDALAEQRAFGDQRQCRLFEDQPFIQRRDGDRQAFLAVDEVIPAVHGFRAQLQTFQQFKQDFPASGRLGGEQDAAGEFIEEIRQGGQWLVGLGFDGQIRQLLRREAFAPRAGVDILLAGNHPRPVFQARKTVFNRQE
jgi:hypothetical protein